MTTVNYNVQLFRDREFSYRFDQWIASVVEFQGRHILNLVDDYASSKSMGYFIWDNNLCDIAEYFSREYFSDNFESIIQAFERAGTHEAYILIIRSALGPTTSVRFDHVNPAHLRILIGNPSASGNLGFYKASTGETSAWIDDKARNLTAESSTTNLTLNETVNLIKLLTVNGMFVEVEFVDPEPVITQNPVEVEIENGQVFAMTSAAVDYYSVKWQFSTDDAETWDDFLEGTYASPILTAIARQPYNTYEFRAVYTNSIGDSVTIPAELKVYPTNTLVSNQGEPYTTNDGEYLTTNETGRTFTVEGGGFTLLTENLDKLTRE